MSSLLTKEQLDLRHMVREFAETEIGAVSAECDRTGTFPLEVYKKAFRMGLHCCNYPEQYGGAGVDETTMAVLFEEIAAADAGFAVSLVTVNFGIHPLLVAGTSEQIRAFCDITVPGAFSAFCLTEPNAGSDAAGVLTTACKVGDEYVLNGAKCFITNGSYADVFVVIASTDRSKGSRGLSAFLVERTRPGISIGKEEDKMGCRLSNTTDVIFQDCVIPASHLIGTEGQGFKIAMQGLNHSRPIVGAMATGICRTAAQHALDYAKERIAFGGPIAKLQAVQMLLADMEIATHASRQLVYHATRLMDAGSPFIKEGSMAKAFACDNAMKVTTDAVQVFGGYGYSREYPVEKLMRDAKIFQIFEGTAQIQRITVAGQMIGKGGR